MKDFRAGRSGRGFTTALLSGALAVGSIVTVLGLCRAYRAWLFRRDRAAHDGSRLAQTDFGQVEYDLRGSGSVVLHFHGGNVGHNGWFFLDHLVRAGYSLLTPDRPGYLNTPLGEHGSPEAQADLAAATLDALGIESVAAVGISAGGPAAVQFCVRHPERVRALVLLSAVTRRTELSEDQRTSLLGRLVMARRFQDVAYLFINVTMKRLPALAMRDLVRTETTYDAEAGRRLIAQVLADPGQRRQVMALADAMVPASQRFDGVSNDLAVQQSLGDLPLAHVRVPTLVVGSRHDGDIGYRNSTHAADRIPGAELITVDQFGHLIWWGDPRVTAELERRIEDFLRSHFRNDRRGSLPENV